MDFEWVAFATTARYIDEENQLSQSGATVVLNTYTETGAGFAEHIK